MSGRLTISSLDSPLARPRPTATEAPAQAPQELKPARRRRSSTTPARPAAAIASASAQLKEAPGSEGDPYAGAGARQFNMRLLQPLHRRYSQLVRELANDDFDTSLTEIVHALLHEGPETTEDVRELIRRWRRLRNG